MDHQTHDRTRESTSWRGAGEPRGGRTGAGRAIRALVMLFVAVVVVLLVLAVVVVIMLIVNAPAILSWLNGAAGWIGSILAPLQQLQKLGGG